MVSCGVLTPQQAWNLDWFSVLGSNIFSNVPFVLVAGKWIDHFAQPELMWRVMALATTFAGNLTILGSVANIIVVESARQHRGEFLGLRAIWHPGHDPDDDCGNALPAVAAAVGQNQSVCLHLGRDRGYIAGQNGCAKKRRNAVSERSSEPESVGRPNACLECSLTPMPHFRP